MSRRLVETLQACEDWSHVTRTLFGPRPWDVKTRVLDAPSNVFEDPVTARLYDALYEDQRVAFLADIVEEVRPLILALAPGSTVAEIGAGPGRLLLALACNPQVRARRYEFVGWDPSPEMFAIAEEHRAASPAPESVKFLQGTTTDRPVQVVLSRTSLLLSRNVLSWIDDASMECLRWRQHLPSGSRLYVREVRRDIPFNQFKRRLLECVRLVVRGVELAYSPQAFAAAYLRAFTPPELRGILARAGFEIRDRPPRSALASDQERGELAEMAFLGHAA